jgi:hypothetical protein
MQTAAVISISIIVISCSSSSIIITIIITFNIHQSDNHSHHSLPTATSTASPPWTSIPPPTATTFASCAARYPSRSSTAKCTSRSSPALFCNPSLSFLGSVACASPDVLRLVGITAVCVCAKEEVDLVLDAVFSLCFVTICPGATGHRRWASSALRTP